MAIVAGLIEKSISANAITALDRDASVNNYESLTERYEKITFSARKYDMHVCE